MRKRNWRIPKLKNMPLRYQLSILFLLFSILPSIGLGTLVNWTVDRIIERQVAGNTLQLIGKVNRTLDGTVDNLQNLTYLIDFNPLIKSFLAENQMTDTRMYETKQFLQGFTSLYSEIAGILVVNSKGDYISNEMYARKPVSLTEETWYKESVRNKGIFTILGHPSARNVTTHVNYRNDEVISVVRSFTDPDSQQVTGAILIDLKLRAISQAAKDMTLGKTGYLMVTDPRGENIYAPTDPIIDRIPNQWFGKDAAGSFSREVNGERLQFIYGTSSYTGWRTVGVFLTRESALEAREIRFYVICFLFLVGFFGLTASYLLSQSISRPIHQLMSFMQKAESGDMAQRYWGDRSDEVGMLGRSFNRMLGQIRKLITLNELKERQKREAELRSLQAHIKPHFLYNTLDTIHWMAKKKGADEVSDLVEALSRLFRIGLNKGEDIIRLTEELEHISSYLQIQHTRYRDRLNYSLELDPAAEQLFVQKLLLQPIVENAIYHGIKARRGPGKIEIRARVTSEELILTVSDDGAGISPERLKELRRKLDDPLNSMEGQDQEAGRSYGMLNVQARIQLAFGSDFGISIDSEVGRGTFVTITQPLMREYPRNQLHEEDQS
ncbi:Sensor histidine kinase YehU [compost metagenome]